MCSEEKDGNIVLLIKLFIVCPLNKSLALFTLSEKQIWGQEVDLLSKYLSVALAEGSVVSLSLQTLTDRDRELNEELFLDTTINFFFFLLFSNHLFSLRAAAACLYVRCHWYPRGPTLKNLLSFVTEWKARGSQHWLLMLIQIQCPLQINWSFKIAGTFFFPLKISVLFT